MYGSLTRGSSTKPAPAAVSIRPAETGDIAAITAIYAREVEQGTASFELTPPDTGEMARRLAAVRAAGLPWLVLEDGGRIAGFAYAAPYHHRPAYRFTAEDSIYLAPWARGRGRGRLLLEALLDASAAAGIRRMIAVIGDSANLASVRLHGRCGFADMGRLEKVGYKFDRWLDVVLMQRHLGGDGPPPDAPAMRERE